VNKDERKEQQMNKPGKPNKITGFSQSLNKNPN
jgi:hypothetical protein